MIQNILMRKTSCKKTRFKSSSKTFSYQILQNFIEEISKSGKNSLQIMVNNMELLKNWVDKQKNKYLGIDQVNQLMPTLDEKGIINFGLVCYEAIVMSHPLLILIKYTRLPNYEAMIRTLNISYSCSIIFHVADCWMLGLDYASFKECSYASWEA